MVTTERQGTGDLKVVTCCGRTLPRLPMPYQAQVRAFYEDYRVEYFVAALILSNFFMQCLQVQMDPWCSSPKASWYASHPSTSPRNYCTYEKVWGASVFFFNVIFLIELLVNAYGRWLRTFLSSGWNYFDVMVVAIGVLDLAEVELYGPLKMLRMARAFRVFRLFGKVESLKKILMSLKRALPGVINSFAMILLMMCIYAVLAVAFFKHVYWNCHDPIYQDELSEWVEGPPYFFGETPRGKCMGPEYYGKFLLALYSLFQILTGESWSEYCVRPLLIFFETSVPSTLGVAIFFISFILVNAVVLLNVVVAVLLDGMQKEAEPPSAADEDCQGDQDGVGKPKTPREELVAVRKEIAAMKEQLNTTKQALNGQLADVLTALQQNPQ
jgi:hypothetical protein